jgi:lipoprotein-anchoring transpeptidase ErfK/SrfK
MSPDWKPIVSTDELLPACPRFSRMRRSRRYQQTLLALAILGGVSIAGLTAGAVAWGHSQPLDVPVPTLPTVTVPTVSTPTITVPTVTIPVVPPATVPTPANPAVAVKAQSPAPTQASVPAVVAELTGVYAIAGVTHSQTLLSKPDGRPLVTVGPQTEWGSPTTLSVLRQRGNWLDVQAPALGNSGHGWVPRSAVVVFYTHLVIEADLSQRRVWVKRDGKVIFTAVTGIGRPSSPTPTGRFFITDELPGSRFSTAAYGCCILALSGHQPNLPQGWGGGDRLALHGTSSPASIGTASSAGCLHLTSAALYRLWTLVSLGTPVFIHN